MMKPYGFTYIFYLIVSKDITLHEKSFGIQFLRMNFK